MDRSENMKRIRAQDTSIEIKLRKALWSKGYRYRKNCKDVYGTPDICFKSKKIAIFCDSDFWHGRSYFENKNIPKTNTEFWINKFNQNINRDKVNTFLSDEGWSVLRFCESEIKNNLETCIKKIVACFNQF